MAMADPCLGRPPSDIKCPSHSPQSVCLPDAARIGRVGPPRGRAPRLAAAHASDAGTQAATARRFEPGGGRGPRASTPPAPACTVATVHGVRNRPATGRLARCTC